MVGPSNLPCFFDYWIDAKPKKRKLPDGSSKVGPPVKKSAVSATSSSRPSVVVKKEGKPSTATATAATVKESKSDSSFFSAPKQKPKLPSFKKAPGGATPSTVTKEAPANVAQPSSTDAFQEALKDMRARKPSPSAPSTSTNNPTASSAVLAGAKPLKKKKSVTWAPDGQLELVKLIERAVYDDDPVDVSLIFLSIIVQYINYVPPMLIYRVRHTHYTMYVNWKEAKAPPCTPTYSKSFSIGRSYNVSVCSHAIVTPALTPYSISSAIVIPDDIDARPRGEGSQERSAQEQRELTALGASYLVQPIPDSPAELPPSSILSQEQVDASVVHMLAGAEIDALSWAPAMTTVSLAGASVSELVGQLAEGANLAVPDALPAPAFDPVVLAQLANSIPQEQLQQLAQMFAVQQQQQPQQPPQPRSDQNSWDSQAPDFSADAANASDAPHDRWPSTPEEPKWSGFGRGRGRGRPLDGVRQFKSRIPCSFYAQGRQAHIPTPPLLSEMKELMENVSKTRCKYGDQCNFSHDQDLS